MSITVKADVLTTVNYAATHSGVSLINKIEITSDSTKNVILRVRAVPEFIYEYKENIVLSAGTKVCQNIKVTYDDSFYRHELIEARDGEIKVDILDPEDPDKVLAFSNVRVHIQPYLHWDASKYAYTMPVFMQPNDPLVAEVLKNAGKYANEKGVRMYGYQGGTKESVKVQAEAIYRALQDQMVHYISSPASFETCGQKIRIPHQVLHEDAKQGTCLDLAVLYATCLEAASLNSVLVVIYGHAFAAVWLEKGKFLSSNLVTDAEEVKRYSTHNGGVLMPVECTAYTDGKNMSFHAAVCSAEVSMEQTYYAIDVEKARECRLNPVYTFTDRPICDPEEEQVEEPEVFQPEQDEKRRMESTDKKLTKLDKLKKQAMDFSLRNNLLAYKKDALRLCLEEFPVEQFLDDGYDEYHLDQLFHQILEKQGMKEEELETALGRMKINDRDAKKENGRGNLYLTLGTLHWTKEGEDTVYTAPLYLCPFEIDKNKRGEHICKADRNGIRFNLVLKEFLMQEHDIDIQELLDDPGCDLDQEMIKLRYFIGKKKNWKVAEHTATIGFYTLPNEAIYYGLEEESVKNHPIVSGLLASKMTWKKDAEEEVLPENESGVYIFQSDSSQTSVIESAGKTTAQVVVGGAGNGKSQTIGNIAAEYIRAGKNVLVLTEKISAAQVLKNLMDSVGFGPFCLEIISGKHDMKKVIRQIENSIHYMEEYEDIYKEDPAVCQKYLEFKNKLEAFHSAMKEKGACGKSMDELIRMHEQYKDLPYQIRWDKAKTAMNHPDAEYLVEGLAETVRYSGKKKNRYAKYWRSYDAADSSRQEAVESADAALHAMTELKTAMSDFEDALNLSFQTATEKKRLQRIVSLSSVMAKCPVIGKQLDVLLNKEEQSLEEQPANDVLGYIEILKAANPVTNRYKDAKKRLDSELKDITTVAERMKLKTMSPEKMEQYVLEKKLHLIQKKGYDRKAEEELQAQYRDYQRCLAKLDGTAQEKEVLEYTLYQIASGKSDAVLKQAETVARKYQVFASAQQRAEQYIVTNKEAFMAEHPDQLMAVLFEEWRQNLTTEKRSRGYEAIYKKAAEAGIVSILEQLEEQVEKPEQMMAAFRKTWCEYNIALIMSQAGEIKEFEPSLYKIDLSHFKGAEKKLREALRKEAIHNQMKRLPKVKEGAPDMPELGILNRMIRMNKKSVSVRNIFEQAPNLLFSMYPCMIMDPCAVAEYLPKDFPPFDLVIIDEGSQMPSYKALIPISKGRRLIIFGDEHQMTPTPFFKRQLEDEEGYFSVMESVLEDAIGCSMPKTMLKYHYRSEHESLIAFSNERYYRNEIITFPACDTAVKGVKYTFVEKGKYDRGGKKTNEPEALRVIETVREIYDSLPEDTTDTVGIITLNLAQKGMIEKMLLKACVNDEGFSSHVDKLVSVVNLEACQGKEWSHIIISPAYGPDENGEFAINLGPLGKEDGGNRLNVLITRARKSMHVVTSLQPEMLGNLTSAGAKDFRDFLSYARGSLQYDTRVKELSKESDSLIQAVAASIRDMGYEVHTNIGASRCKVDIGVVSKKNPNVYLMGILLDQFSDSGFSVKDAEVLRNEVLERKGWNVYRLHTLNWYEDAGYEAALIKEELKKIEEEIHE